MNNEIETMSTSSNEQVFFEFKDLPDTSTAINSKNLNGMQEKIKQSIDNKQSLPNGGTTGQVLGKASDSDYDVAWINQTGGGADYDAAPVGAMFDYPSLTPPIGYKICDGSELSRTEYSELFSVIGTTYGSGDGSNTFNLPNRLGRLNIGYNSDDDDFNALGKTGGSKTHTQTIGEMPRHQHNIGRSGGLNPGYTSFFQSNSSAETSGTSYTGSGQAMNIMNPYIVSCPIIKVTGTAILKGNVVDSLEDNSTTNAPSQRVVKETIGDLSQLNTSDTSSLVNAINSVSEIITNSQGTAIKYADGIMICYGNYTGTDDWAFDYFSQFNRTTEGIEVTFPSIFTSVGSVTITPLYGSYISCVMINSTSNNSFSFTAIRPKTVDQRIKNIDFKYISIGKWK